MIFEIISICFVVSVYGSRLESFVLSWIITTFNILHPIRPNKSKTLRNSLAWWKSLLISIGYVVAISYYKITFYTFALLGLVLIEIIYKDISLVSRMKKEVEKLSPVSESTDSDDDHLQSISPEKKSNPSHRKL